MSVNVYSARIKVLIRGHNLNVSYWRQNRHFTLASEPREGLVIYSIYSHLKVLFSSGAITCQLTDYRTLCRHQITFKNNIKFFGMFFVTMFSYTTKPVLNKANISLDKPTIYIYASVTIFSFILLCIKSVFLQ